MKVEKRYDHPDLGYVGFSKDANREMDSLLDDLGYEYLQGQFGGVLPVDIVAHLNLRLDSVYGQVAVGILTNIIYDSVKSIAQFVRTRRAKDAANKPVINVYIYEGRNSFKNLQIAADEMPVKLQIEKMLNMKQALILHGTDAAPDQNWFPWLKAKLEAEGYNVWVPLLPENHTPNCQTYGDFLFKSDFDFTDSLIIGHSSGAVEVLNLLNDERLSHINMAVIVSAWYKGVPPGMEASQFAGLFPPEPEGYDYTAMKAKADRIALIHGSDDPYCPLEQAETLAHKLGAPLTIVPNGHHLGARYSELPELWSIIEPNL